MLDQLVDALILRRGDGDDRDAQHGFHLIDLDRAAVSGHFVHHIQRDHHGDAHLQQLHGQVQIALDIGGVHDVDNGMGLILKDKIPGNQLFA